MDLRTQEFQTVSYISGPLLFVQQAKTMPFGSMVKIIDADNTERSGQVLEVSEEHAVVQILEDTTGLDVASTVIRLEEDVARLGVSPDMIGRVFSGSGKPIDGLPPLIPEERIEIIGKPINPAARMNPADFVQTGISAIDGFNTLVRGQKIPIFSGTGLPANEIAALLLQNAKVLGEHEQFAVVFGAMGLTQREAAFFRKAFVDTGASEKLVSFMNLASDPTIERIMTPRLVLTTAEYLAFEQGMHVLVILTDMTSYCEALREIGAAREEIPGRRGYPGYMYTDLASLYERAGQVKGKDGTVTQIPILTMPDDDMTHPIPDLTGYITEGQIVLNRQLNRSGFFPPIDVLPSLSRLMNSGIGEGQTREDHRALADQLYACYANGRDIRRLVAIVGEEALTEIDRKYLKFADNFENQMINQGNEDRSIFDTLNLGWKLLSDIPQSELTRLNKDLISRYFTEILSDGSPSLSL
ncbi:MAG: V-type ATP synthase subunit B [bacterium]